MFNLQRDLFLLLLALSASLQAEIAKKISLQEYQDKVYAAWLGQCVGNIYGLPHENIYIEKPGPDRFPYGYKDTSRLRKYNGAFSDDDTDIEYMYLLAMEKYGVEPTYAQLAGEWMEHVRDRIWLANRAALAAMHFGYGPPYTGNKDRNPHWFQIDPQLINEIWAITAPGMVLYAAAKSDWAAHIMDDGWGVEPTVHYAAMFAAAFFESDIEKLIDIGSSALPPNSRFAETVETVKSLYRQYPEDWKRAREIIVEKYYRREPEDTRTIWNANLNGACGILALLYGQGDFQKTLDLACAIGMDADNQAATMAGLLGVVSGTSGLPHDLLFPFPDRNWKAPFNDTYKNVTRYGLPDAGLKDLAARTVRQAQAVITGHGGKRITEKGEDYFLINAAAKYVAPLELPNGPLPPLGIGKALKLKIFVSGGAPPFRWRIAAGNLPPGIQFEDGVLSGIPAREGVYRLTLSVKDARAEASRDLLLVVRGPNLAPLADKILSNVEKTNTVWRDSLWLSVPHSYYAENIKDIIRDGNRIGPGSTFYSIAGGSKPQTDFYGYRWRQPQRIGLVVLSTGTVEENGGWFDTLGVEYLDEEGKWLPVKDLIISPSLPDRLPEDIDAYNKPHFAEFLLAFEPVLSRGVRVIGEAGGVNHWKSPKTYFTSITELAVYSPLPGYRGLARK